MMTYDYVGLLTLVLEFCGLKKPHLYIFQKAGSSLSVHLT